MKIVYIYITSWIVSTTGKVCNIYIYTNFPYFSPDKSLSSHGFVVTVPGHFTGCSVHYRSIPLQFTEQYAWHLLEGNNMDNYSSSFLSSSSTSFSSSSSSFSFSSLIFPTFPQTNLFQAMVLLWLLLVTLQAAPVPAPTYLCTLFIVKTLHLKVYMSSFHTLIFSSTFFIFMTFRYFKSIYPILNSRKYSTIFPSVC